MSGNNGFDVLATLRPAAAPDAALAELAQLAARCAPADGVHATAIESLSVMRTSEPSNAVPAVYQPSLCVVVQGRKRSLLADEIYIYDPLHYLVVSVPLPAFGQVIEASPDKPYLCLRITIDRKMIGELMLQVRDTAGRTPQPADGRGMYLAQMSTPLLDAMLRLMRLLSTPEEVPIVAPLALREIHYRVLIGELGARLLAISEADSQPHRTASGAPSIC